MILGLGRLHPEQGPELRNRLDHRGVLNSDGRACGACPGVRKRLTRPQVCLGGAGHRSQRAEGHPPCAKDTLME